MAVAFFVGAFFAAAFPGAFLVEPPLAVLFLSAFAELDLAGLAFAGLDLAGLDLAAPDLAVLDLLGLDFAGLDFAGLDFAVFEVAEPLLAVVCFAGVVDLFAADVFAVDVLAGDVLTGAVLVAVLVVLFFAGADEAAVPAFDAPVPPVLFAADLLAEDFTELALPVVAFGPRVAPPRPRRSTLASFRTPCTKPNDRPPSSAILRMLSPAA